MALLTDAGIKRLPTKPVAYRHFEGGAIPGFHLQITPAGTKTFYLQVTRDGQRRFYRLGQYPALPLAAAREKARELLAQIEQGQDPRRATPPTTPPPQGTVEDLLRAWLVYQAHQHYRHLDLAEKRIRYNLPAEFLSRPAASITPMDIRNVLAPIYQRDAPAMATAVQHWLSSLFRYGLRADHDPRRPESPIQFGLTFNPVSAIPAYDGFEPRDRVLSWDDVRRLWHDPQMPWHSRQACRLLLCTGARVNEIVQAAWTEFDFTTQTWLLPPARSKNKRALLTPILPLMSELLSELRAVWPERRWLFPSRHLSKDQCWGRDSLHKSIRLYCQTVQWEPPWQPRDLRRTWKTLTGEIGITKDLRDRIQNHALSDVSSVHYDRYDYLDEKRAALLQWDAALRTKILPAPSLASPVNHRSGESSTS